MKTLLLFLITVVALAGCATHAEKQSAADSYYDKQANFVKAQADAQKPIWQVKGVTGKEITFGGISEITVWGSGGNQQQPLQVAPIPRGEFVEALGMVKDTVLGLAPYALGAKVISGMTTMGNQTMQAGVAGHGASTSTVTTTTSTSNANQSNRSTVSNANQANTSTVSSANQANTSSSTANQANGNTANQANGNTTSAATTTSSNTASNANPTTTTTTTTNTPTTTSSTTNPTTVTPAGKVCALTGTPAVLTCL